MTHLLNHTPHLNLNYTSPLPPNTHTHTHKNQPQSQFEGELQEAVTSSVSLCHQSRQFVLLSACVKLKTFLTLNII